MDGNAPKIGETRTSEESPSGRPRLFTSRLVTALTLLAALSPALAAVWTHPSFVTQDGPSHLYNAEILVQSFSAESPFRDYFEVRWEALPNWAGHALLMGLVTTLPSRTADRAMTTLTLLAFAVSVGWLGRRIAPVGARMSPWSTAALSAVLALNVAWLLGFGSFLLGACVFCATLSAWWRGRKDGWSGRRAVVLAGWMVLGYFCHLVSLGVTAGGVVILELFTPMRPADGLASKRWGRRLTTLAGLAPLAPLAAVYLGLMRRGGGIAPEWKHLRNALSPRDWLTQLSWVDPISLAGKGYLPLLGRDGPWHLLLAPAVLLGLGLACGLISAWRSGRGPWRDPERRGWWVLAGALLFGGLVAPDTLGASHGEYLQQRVVLLGLVALVPVLELSWRGWGRPATLALAAALAMQSAVVWDYAADCERTAGAMLRALPRVGNGRRVAACLTGIVTNFRANPALHSDCLLGVGTGNILWGDYETRSITSRSSSARG
ncbi:MAG: hypothetical protein U0835_06100 [Isosphaeraceae bacterium]